MYEHGTTTAYARDKCRCELCVARKAEYRAHIVGRPCKCGRGVQSQSGMCNLCQVEKRRRRKNADPVAFATKEWAVHLKTKYRVTPEWYETTLTTQGGCAICGVEDPGARRFAVDHDHACCPGLNSCGECIRGLLCHKCNRGLGLFVEDPERLRRAIAYLTHWSAATKERPDG